MSKAEDLSKQYKDFREQCGIKDPVMLNEIEEAYFEGYLQAEKDLTDKAKLSSGCDGFYYGQGYKQAKKELELTWEDIHAISIIEDKLIHELCLNDQTLPNTQEFFEEVLKRFKERKKNHD